MTFVVDKWSVVDVIRVSGNVFSRSREVKSQTHLQDITVPLMICHARHDLDIPVSHSAELFDAILDLQLPALEHTLKLEQKDWQLLEKRKTMRKKLVSVSDIDRVGTMQGLEREEGNVWFLESLYGGHNGVSHHEGIMGVIGDKILNI